MKLFDGMTVENGELNISGVGVNELKAQYGTPLYVYDENMLVNQCRTLLIILKVLSSIQKFFTHRKLLVV